ncbi:hypothetical protein [Paractinoplanes toevensis]|uniref:Uncharacterized protein n=1 Tax=Paractinoplanes toevensis TaxID=571911 RepID=A0A919W7B5_9ACTN|nr:hypothetical protein [Actinoplanes toevensis]GIM88746.1 hypothetical protein Ato02nite_005390 [Actinoplanes toevensis]
MRDPCPTCSGPSRETTGMVCETCGTSYRNGSSIPYPRLPDPVALHVCLTCGSAVPLKGIGFHDDWHVNISRAAIEALSRQTQHP